jgi:hypothetical protein
MHPPLNQALQNNETNEHFSHGIVSSIAALLEMPDLPGLRSGPQQLWFGIILVENEPSSFESSVSGFKSLFLVVPPCTI